MFRVDKLEAEGSQGFIFIQKAFGVRRYLLIVQREFEGAKSFSLPNQHIGYSLFGLP